jgi:tryptophanyl-tRNA synthetase
MSKSVSDPAGTILLTDKPEDAVKKIMGATTDSVGTINNDWEKQPGIANLLTILSLLTDKKDVADWIGKSNYGDLKKEVASAVSTFLNDFQTKLDKISISDINSILEKNEDHIRTLANEKLTKVQIAVGLRQ